jgi:hypothetical protein
MNKEKLYHNFISVISHFIHSSQCPLFKAQDYLEIEERIKWRYENDPLFNAQVDNLCSYLLYIVDQCDKDGV